MRMIYKANCSHEELIGRLRAVEVYVHQEKYHTLDTVLAIIGFEPEEGPEQPVIERLEKDCKLYLDNNAELRKENENLKAELAQYKAAAKVVEDFVKEE